MKLGHADSFSGLSLCKTKTYVMPVHHVQTSLDLVFFLKGANNMPVRLYLLQ